MTYWRYDKILCRYAGHRVGVECRRLDRPNGGVTTVGPIESVCAHGWWLCQCYSLHWQGSAVQMSWWEEASVSTRPHCSWNELMLDTIVNYQTSRFNGVTAPGLLAVSWYLTPSLTIRRVDSVEWQHQGCELLVTWWLIMKIFQLFKIFKQLNVFR